MKVNVLLSSIVFSLSILFSSVSSLADIGIINFVIASFITWIIEWLISNIKKDNDFEFTSKRTIFLNFIYVCITVVLLLHLVSIFVVLEASLESTNIDIKTIYVLLLFLALGCFMSFNIESNTMIHIGRIISYLIIGIILIIVFNIPYNLLEIDFGSISIIEVMKLLPICLSHTFYILYLKFKYIKESVIGNIIASLFLILLMIFINSTDLNIHEHEIPTLLSSLTLVGSNLVERVDVFIVCMILAVEAYQICVIGNVLGRLCVSYVGQYAMKLIIGSVIIVGLLLNISELIIEMILVFGGLLTALFTLII